MLLQTLVENAIKHGIAPLKEGGTLRITAQVVEKELVLRVVNPRPADAHEHDQRGRGPAEFIGAPAAVVRRSRQPAARSLAGRPGHRGSAAARMKALVVDDEPLARRELRRLLDAFPAIQVVGEAGNIDEARARIEELSPDVVFLDIQMPGGTGFDLLTQLDRVPRIVFTTAYDQYAVKAFDVNALDYLLKPIEPERLATALRKIQATPPHRGHGRAARAAVHPRRSALLVRAAARGERVHRRRQLRAAVVGQGAAVARTLAGRARGEARSEAILPREPQPDRQPGFHSSRWNSAKVAGCTCRCAMGRRSRSPAGRQDCSALGRRWDETSPSLKMFAAPAGCA